MADCPHVTAQFLARRPHRDQERRTRAPGRELAAAAVPRGRRGVHREAVHGCEAGRWKGASSERSAAAGASSSPRRSRCCSRSTASQPEKAKGIPESRTTLFDLAVRWLLAGPWRVEGREPDEEECLRLLEGWAWEAAEKNPVSGVGTWADEFLADASLREDDGPHEMAILEAVAHVAVPVGPREYKPADPVSRQRRKVIPRRFIHRSVREYLVACYLAAQQWEIVADELVDHLWHDPDWEQAGPMALALHPEHDAILRAMLCRVTRSEEIPADLSPFDSCLDLCRFLSETAMNRPEAEWEPWLRKVIAAARRRLAFEGADEDLHPAPGWHACDRQIKEDLISQMANADSVGEVLGGLLSLAPNREELRRARQIIWDHMTRADGVPEVCSLTQAMVQANPSPEERSAARKHLWGRLRGATSTASIFLVARTLANLGLEGPERERLRTLVVRTALDSSHGDNQHGAFSVLVDLVKTQRCGRVIGRLSGLFLAFREEPPTEVLEEFLISDRSALREIADYLVGQWNAGRDPIGHLGPLHRSAAPRGRLVGWRTDSLPGNRPCSAGSRHEERCRRTLGHASGPRSGPGRADSRVVGPASATGWRAGRWGCGASGARPDPA